MEVAASAVAFGTVIAQLGAVAVRLKRLWNEIANVPESIRESLAEIEQIGLLFAEMENSIQDPAYPNLPSSFWTGPLMQLSLNRAKQALDALQSVTDDLNGRLKNAKSTMQRKLVAIRGILDKEKIRDLQAKLARSVDLLWKSYDLASNRMLKETVTRCVTQTIRSEMITVSVNEANGTRPPQQAITGVTHAATRDITTSHNQQDRSMSKKRTRTVFRCRIPTWWSTTVCEVCFAPLPGWNYGLRVYNIVPENSNIIRSVKEGDMTTVMQLFSSKEASVYDQDENGSTLLQHAVWSQANFHSAGGDHQYPMQLITALLTWGLRDTIHDSSLHHASAFRSVAHQALYAPNPHPDRRELLRLLWACHPVAEDHEAEMDSSAALSGQDAPSFHHLLYHVKLERIRNAAFDISGISDPNPTWITKDGKVTALHVLRSLEGQDSLVHSTAVSIGRSKAYIDCDIPPHKQATADRLLQAVTAVCTPGDLHHIETIKHPFEDTSLWRGTPLVSLIGGIVFGLILESIYCFYWWRQPNRAQQGAITLRNQETLLQKALQAYVCGLQAARTDLTAYGQKEHTILHNDLDALRGNFDADSLLMQESPFPPFFEPSLGPTVVPFSIVDLEFGAKPEQWRLKWEPELEAMARQFWELIERAPLLRMPGSWVD